MLGWGVVVGQGLGWNGLLGRQGKILGFPGRRWQPREWGLPAQMGTGEECRAGSSCPLCEANQEDTRALKTPEGSEANGVG